jgi:hypothetical protein
MLEDAGYRRHEMGKLSIRYVRAVIQHAREKDGSLRVHKQAEQGPPADQWGELKTILLRRGYRRHQIQRRIAEMQRQQAEVERAQREMLGRMYGGRS